MKKIVMTANDALGLAGEMSMHFGHCSHFVVAQLDDTDRLVGAEVLANPFADAHQPGQLPTYIQSLGADVVLAGGMGAKAIELFARNGIEVVTGARPGVGETLNAYLAGELNGVSQCAHDHAH
ncbi:NifB/NifX family molybdenum-iron cluster-binding protein [Marichromatium gracile]|uniref:Putative Fe-Mo cluster-binding NifX family protein n=1 Tax=Marichromatium gracile TaxID=1048 RepID=A0A4R4ADW1_MARGR|nr:NifB/NifX family molybdenum-iron cluster-binding protein [Marichromatium gracile]MBK1709189.1 dinitrogenase iron-molybdenum cofactor biosynthesis protein [Marichromatium gracile]TCW37084.1 putative Fe-Mo cluster-binding NifX family protein [Marichromatium gracile]